MTIPFGRLGVLVGSTLLVAAFLAGCGDEDAENLRKLGEYTPTNVADELLSRFKSLGQVQEKTSERIANGEDESKGGGDQKKTARAGSPFAELIADIAGKAARITSAPPAEVHAQIIKRVDDDPDLAEKDRGRIKAALDEAFNP